MASCKNNAQRQTGHERARKTQHQSREREDMMLIQHQAGKISMSVTHPAAQEIEVGADEPAGQYQAPAGHLTAAVASEQ
jgi:hypothetical protein